VFGETSIIGHVWSESAGHFAFLTEPGELIFDQDNVKSGTQILNLQIRNFRMSIRPLEGPNARRRPGRPKGAGGMDDSEHLTKMREWLIDNPGRTPRDAAKVIESQINIVGPAQPDSVVRRLTKKYLEKFPL
jgi:hypothetical protein